jgi:MoaA/NifB/PqqE/SkfB family radical SAM enzyme
MKVDYLYALETILPVKRLSRAILCLTNLCNSRCKTCSMWKNKKREELDFKTLEKFAGTKLFRKIRFLTLTGGEPFLRKDIDKVVRMLKKKNPKVHITILSNALMPEIIYDKVKNMSRDVLITFSFNGKEKAHDETRGVKGNFKKLLESMEKLNSLNQKMNFIFTVTKENYDQLLWAWDFAKKNNTNIMFSPEMDYGRLEHETGNRTLNEEQKKVVLSQLKKIYGERSRGFFDYTYYLFFKRFYEKKTVTNKCYAGTNSIYIDFNGDVYPCENLVGRIRPVGNIKSGLNLAKDYSPAIKKMKCYEGCYLLCEMVRNLRKQPLKTMREK